MTSLQYSHNLGLRPAENLGLTRARSWVLSKGKDLLLEMPGSPDVGR